MNADKGFRGIRTVESEPYQLPGAVTDILLQGGRFLNAVATDERHRKDVEAFVLRYFFATECGATASSAYTAVSARIPAERPSYASVTSILPAAAWAERESHDLFGLVPVGHPDLRPLVLHEHWPQGVYPLRKDYPLERRQTYVDASWTYPKVDGEGVFEVPVGPIHAGIIEPGHFRFQVMGDSVLHLEPKLFYTHRGLEKRVEGLDVSSGLPFAEQVCGVCSVSHAISYATAAESLSGVTIPIRASYLRVLVAELERLYNHVGDLGNICAGIGYAYGSTAGSALKEQLLRANAALTGHRYLKGSVALGGMAVDVTERQLLELERALSQIEPRVEDLVQAVVTDDVVQNRFRKTGVLSVQNALDLGVVGPAARASGLPLDVRRDQPYLAYDALEFEVPVQVEGDVFARYWQRLLEARQSFSLIRQVLNRLPEGPVKGPIEDYRKESYAVGVTESPRGENFHFLATDEAGRIARYHVRSATYANWPAVAKAVQGNIVPDFPLINKSFELCYACCDR
ncbi:MAG: NADH-quinone oxidoreductase subunit C [Alicyclobacillaceae bacterium]|nr:NADH-quinone oxidoreductase subunit C [Alicyclobacillaceae bacterium]